MGFREGLGGFSIRRYREGAVKAGGDKRRGGGMERMRLCSYQV